MNTSGAGLSAYEVKGMVAISSSLLADADTATTVVFTTSGARSFNAATGQATYSETPTSVSAWFSDLSLEEVGKIQGAQVGDAQILIRYADLATEPDTGDRCSVGSVDYRVYRVIKGPINAHFVVYVQRVA